jgi:hypothetical protein
MTDKILEFMVNRNRSDFVLIDGEIHGVVCCRNVIKLYQYFDMFVFRYFEDGHDTSD